MKKSIKAWHKEKMYLEELSDEEINVIKNTAPRYKNDEDFRMGIDAEIRYRMEKKLSK